MRDPLYHEECEEHEVFLTNATQEQFEHEMTHWETKRMGTIAYDEDGERLPHEKGLYPVFVDSMEAGYTVPRSSD